MQSISFIGILIYIYYFEHSFHTRFEENRYFSVRSAVLLNSLQAGHEISKLLLFFFLISFIYEVDFGKHHNQLRKCFFFLTIVGSRKDMIFI